MSERRVLFYVQHLLGIGHLKRAATIVDAMTRCGLEVTLVSGGFPVPSLLVNARQLVQLPPAGAADLSFRDLVDVHGQPVDEAWKRVRVKLLLDTWRRLQPHAVVMELFPFGRRQMRFELLPLLDAIKGEAQPPLVVCSVRDILGGATKDPTRQDQMLQTFNQYFDELLVHGDPTVIPFGLTFRHADQLGTRLNYTGYVVDPAPTQVAGSRVGTDEVLVSVGGGAVGRQLLEAAIRARPLTTLSGLHWRLLTGLNAAQGTLAELDVLAGTAGAGAISIERHRADFMELLQNCRLSVSQAGYNTTLETLAASARAVLVPFAGGAEVEQNVRARILGQRGRVEVVEESDLTPEKLARAIDRAALQPVMSADTIRLDGAQRSAELVSRWIGERFS